MEKKYKAIMLDMDGVVVKDAASLPTPRVQEAIRKAQEQGVVVTFVTGRPLHRVMRLIDVLKISLPVVVEGGARIYDPRTKKDLYTAFIEPSAVQAVTRLVVDRHLPANFSSIRATYSTSEHIALLRIHRTGRGTNYPPELEAERDAYKEITSSAPEVVDVTGIAVYALTEGVEEIVHSLKRIPSLHITDNESKSLRGWRVITINDMRGTKQHGVLEFAKLMGLDPRDMIGVGDEDTDFPLLMACGYKVAMGNAVESLKAIADYVAPTVEEDGLVEVIEKFILHQE